MKYDKQPFSPSGEYVARKPFDFQGEPVLQGAPFPYLKLGCSARKLRQLWDNGFIVPAGSLPQAPAGIPPAPTPLGQPPSSEPQGDSPDEAKAKAEADAKAKRREAGRKAAESRKAKAAAAAPPVASEAVEVSDD